ncbi:efflux RND transporter periplasmic adaptor subunit [Brumimicrobium aurantiacum]|uniref:Efflux RND transporter periplasmic adaptor subunit n=1 Tax=Brumimicrobium aurantiacum TaxID=1737063 RepID=A0A3E1EYM9_9FLAO|nr:efflux RND transporter periplasmic adaptor subunit [Brumimicrobium aurantiacum]RFC54670.1 efflux RND transporter periplasmic adaptor subunit [Brumimicrobium aurantiacum]
MSQKKSSLLFITIIIILIIALLYLLKQTNSKIKSPSEKPDAIEYQLLEVKEERALQIHAIVQPTIIEEVIMHVNGIVDSQNKIITKGTQFSKDELLIKLDRVEQLYELLAQQNEFKTSLKELLDIIMHKVPDQFQKWNAYDKQINVAQTIPSLPSTKSTIEKNIVDGLNIEKQFYKLKNLKINLQKHYYSAPFSGFVYEGSIHPGSTISSNKVILRIAKNGSYILKSKINIRDFERLGKIDSIQFTHQKSNSTVYADLIHSEFVSMDSTYIEAVFAIKGDHQYLNGQILTATINAENPTIPNSSIHNDSVTIFKNNELFKLGINVIAKSEDSSRVKGLPKESFIIVNP